MAPPDVHDDVHDDVRDEVRAHYAHLASTISSLPGPTTGTEPAPCCGPAPDGSASSCCGADSVAPPAFGAALYPSGELRELPVAAVSASLGCGNPILLADLHEGETVVDLGCGGGIDVLLAAQRVGARGFVHGVDMTAEMLDLARRNAASAGVENVDFLAGVIEDLPLPDGAADVVISNCVVNLSADAPAVLAEMFRVLRPGGRIAVSDVVAEDRLGPADRAARGSRVGCVAGALSRQEFLDGLAGAGFVEADVTFTHRLADGIHGALVRAVKPERART